MSNPATEMEIRGTVIALMAGLNETKMLNGVSKIVFEPSRNTGTLDDSAHPIKNYGIPTPFTVYENGVIMRIPNVDASIKPVPSPLTDWGKITVTYTDVKLKDALEQLFTKYPNSIQLPFEPTSTAVAPVAAAAPVAPAVPVAAAAPRPRTKRVKKKKLVPVAPPPPPPPPINGIKPTVGITTDGVSAPYNNGQMWCEVIIGNGEVGKPGDHLKVCSSQEGLQTLVKKYEKTNTNEDPYANEGGLPLKKPDGME